MPIDSPHQSSLLLNCINWDGHRAYKLEARTGPGVARATDDQGSRELAAHDEVMNVREMCQAKMFTKVDQLAVHKQLHSALWMLTFQLLCTKAPLENPQNGRDTHMHVGHSGREVAILCAP